MSQFVGLVVSVATYIETHTHTRVLRGRALPCLQDSVSFKVSPMQVDNQSLKDSTTGLGWPFAAI